MQANRLADLCQRRSGLLRSGEALAPLLPCSLQLPLVIKLGVLRFGKSFLFGIPRHAESLFAKSRLSALVLECALLSLLGGLRLPPLIHFGDNIFHPDQLGANPGWNLKGNLKGLSQSGAHHD